MKKRRRLSVWLTVTIPIASLTLSLLALEFVFVWRYPMAGSRTLLAFDPRVGRIFQPDSAVKYTNYFDFAVTQSANSLGFLDREPTGPRKPGTFRILVLGDSYVEAIQVPIARKFHVLLEGMLATRYPGRRFETAAFGRSGAGTAAELAYYETYGHAFHPDLVVVVFVHNDFSDSSPLLESLTYGWLPEHPPWPLFEPDGSGGFRRYAADPDFPQKMIQIRPVHDLPTALRDHLSWSRFAQWALGVGEKRWRWSAARQTELETRRLARLRMDPHYAIKLAGWRYPDDLDHNDMFFAKKMPPVFDEAEVITDHAFALLAEAGRRDGFKLLVVAIPPCSATPWWKRNQRDVVDKGLLIRLERITARHTIPLLDLASAFAKRGNPDDAHWPHDSHWNSTGHRWTADAIVEYIGANEETLLGALR